MRYSSFIYTVLTCIMIMKRYIPLREFLYHGFSYPGARTRLIKDT